MSAAWSARSSRPAAARTQIGMPRSRQRRRVLSRRGAGKRRNAEAARRRPSAAVNPLTVADAGGLRLLAQTGEFLAFDNNMTLQLQPMLATVGGPTRGTVWTFELRKGVKFHNGKPMTADDVVYTFKRSPIPRTPRTRCRLSGVLSPPGVLKVDDPRSRSTSSRPTGTSRTWAHRTTTT